MSIEGEREREETSRGRTRTGLRWGRGYERRRANGDPLERRFTVKGFTNRRQVFATSADRKLARPHPPLFNRQRSAVASRPPFHHGFPPRWRRVCYTRRSHIDEIYVRGRPILRMRPH